VNTYSYPLEQDALILKEKAGETLNANDLQYYKYPYIPRVIANASGIRFDVDIPLDMMAELEPCPLISELLDQAWWIFDRNCALDSGN
jgi:hypothetical protein